MHNDIAMDFDGGSMTALSRLDLSAALELIVHPILLKR